MTGGYLVYHFNNAGSTLVFATLNVASNVLSAIDVVICSIDFLTLDDKNEKDKALISALFSLLSIVSLFQEYKSKGEISFNSLDDLKNAFSSLVQWTLSKKAEEVLEWSN